MIEPKLFLEALEESKISFVTGVPDSLLKDVCAYITMNFPKNNHVIATNEGSAIGLAIGHYLACGRPALVYMQNSGLGNIINPIASLADTQVYGVPMVLMIGWRGEIASDGKQIHDEPQHVKQGQVTLGQLDLLGISYLVVDGDTNISSAMKELVKISIEKSSPVALVIRKQTFASYKMASSNTESNLLKREEVIEALLLETPKDIPVVSTTGMASRELFELRKKNNSGHQRDFLTVGGMGHASQIATGIAITKPNQKVLCIDGDGAMLMHMGSLVISAEQKNLIHVVINNGAHDSVGAQPTKAENLDLTKIAKDCGYKLIKKAETREQISASIKEMLHSNDSSFLEIRCKCGARSDLGRPDRTPKQNKIDFMNFIQEIL
jgi:phosphonopyruvate decarboxylase